VSVDPTQRRRGVGKALAERIVEQLKRRRATRVEVDFWLFNKPARAFFAGVGFVSQRAIAGMKV